jgi:integrase
VAGREGSVFRTVIASARDEKLKPLYPREWDIAYITVPKVNKRKQHRPTLLGEEVTHIVANAKGRYQVGSALLAGCDARISELLALRIEKHISHDRSTLFIRQQRGKKGGVKTTLKTDAAFRDIDLHSALAKMLSDYIGDRKEGFLLQTRSGNMLSPESFFVMVWRQSSSGWEELAFPSMLSADFGNRCCSGRNAAKS